MFTSSAAGDALAQMVRQDPNQKITQTQQSTGICSESGRAGSAKRNT